MPKGLFKETSIEKKVRKELRKLKLRWKQNCSIKSGGLVGEHFNVDFLVDICDKDGNKVNECVIECNGDYFHSHPKKYLKEQYDEIQKSNYYRDVKKMAVLNVLYSYVILWECEINERSFSKRFRSLFEEARSEILAGKKFQYWNDRNVFV